MVSRYAGGLKAAQTNKERYGEDFYRKAGRLGGLKSRAGGFAARPELARTMGSRGGSRSKKGWKLTGNDGHRLYYINMATGEEMVVDYD